MNFLIIRTQASEGVYYINGIFHCFKIQEGQYITPLKNNRGGISPAAKAVNNAPLCTEPSSSPEHFNFLWLKLLLQLKIQSLEENFFLSVTDSICPIKDMSDSGGSY